VAEKLAAELGDLPLAAAQAAAYLEQTDLPAPDYLRRFQTRRAALLAYGDVLGYQGRSTPLGRCRWTDCVSITRQRCSYWN